MNINFIQASIGNRKLLALNTDTVKDMKIYAYENPDATIHDLIRVIEEVIKENKLE